MFDVGRVCMKTAGREAGCYCVVLKKLEDNYVLVTGPRELTRVRRRKCNTSHLEPLMEKISISQEAPDSEVLKALEADSVLKRLGVSKPIKAEGKKHKEPSREERPKAVKKAKLEKPRGKERKPKKEAKKSHKKPKKETKPKKKSKK